MQDDILQEPSKQLDELAHKIIGAAIEVHRTLGPGFLESVYEEALCIELSLRDISFERQKAVGLSYKGHPIGDHRLDILAENQIVVELKAVDNLAPIHEAQIISYLKSSELQLGLLINFNCPVLRDGIKRLILSASIKPS